MKFNIFALILCLVACAKPIKPIVLEPSDIKRSDKTHAYEVKFVNVSYAANAKIDNNAILLPYFRLLWKDAVQSALDKSRVFSDDNNRKVTVRVIIDKFWLSMEPGGPKNNMEAEVRYEVVLRPGDTILYAKTIKSDNGGSYKTIQTLTETWNKVIQTNIHKFVDDLSKSSLI